ncbi:hypothetical protein [Denitromonas iodatirespirans]|nr:hypothetical protein [Denitromonas iodatirespirans]
MAIVVIVMSLFMVSELKWTPRACVSFPKKGNPLSGATLAGALD